MHSTMSPPASSSDIHPATDKIALPDAHLSVAKDNWGIDKAVILNISCRLQTQGRKQSNSSRTNEVSLHQT